MRGRAMSVTSQYFFLFGFFNGPFVGVNTVKAADQPFSESAPSGQFTVNRPNAELLFNLGAAIATNATVGLVATQLINAGASLTSGIRVQGVPWVGVPYFITRPLAHKITDMLVRVDFDFHIETPWFCSDADGTYSVYLFFFLDSAHHLQASVDGVWFTYNGGGPFCTGTITKGLNASVNGVIKQVQPILAAAIKPAAGVSFKNLYLLPGDGHKAAGVFNQDASLNTALALVPG